MLRKVLYSLPIIAIILAATAYFLVNREAKIQADILVNQALATGSYQEVSYESVKVDLFNGELSLSNLRVIDLQGNEYILNEVLISDYDYLHEVPYYLTFQASGISFPRGLPPLQTNNNLELELYISSLLEQDVIPVALNYRYVFEPENDNLMQNEMSIGLEDSATLSFSSTIKKFSLESIIASQAQNPSAAQSRELMGTFFQMEIPAASISIEDQGIVQALVTLKADQEGISIADYRQQTATTMRNLSLILPPPTQQIAAEIAEELVTFLDGDKTLNISIEPQYDGSIQRLQAEMIGAFFSGNYAAIFELLNLKVETQ